MDQRSHGGALEVGGFSRVLLQAPLGPVPPFAVPSIFCVLQATAPPLLSVHPSGFPVKLRLYPGVPGRMKSPLDRPVQLLFSWKRVLLENPLSPKLRVKVWASVVSLVMNMIVRLSP